MDNLIESFNLEKIKGKETKETGRYELKIYHDDVHENPRDWQGRTVALVELENSDISIIDDKLDIAVDDSENLDDDDQKTLKRVAKRQAGPYGLIVPYVLEDWRSNGGRCFLSGADDNVSGYVTMTRKQLKSEKLTKKQARKTIESMLDNIDQYLQGNVFVAVVEHITVCSHGHEHADSVESLGGIMVKDGIDCKEILEIMGLEEEYKEA